MQDWLSRSDKERKEELRQRAFDLWLSCHTQEEIAQAVGYDQAAITRFLKASGFMQDGKVSVLHKTPEIADEPDDNSLDQINENCLR